jgi:hypothetical protein
MFLVNTNIKICLIKFLNITVTVSCVNYLELFIIKV